MTPAYILEESLLRKNLALISEVARRGNAEIILALKAFAQWRTFPIFREYIEHTTASSLYEARLSAEAFGGLTYTYTPAYEESTFEELLQYSEHITFNSLSQYRRFYPLIQRWQDRDERHHRVSVGLRINPEYSDITTELYNPCAPGSRFGVLATQLPDQLPEGIEGFHFHCLCENGSDSLVRVLQRVEEKFSAWLPQLKWLNMGGGHLMTRKDYDIELLVTTLQQLHQRYPNLRLIMEPGSAFLWQTGYLRAEVVDVVENHGIKTAILNTSFTCHMPDCLEMPYYPAVHGAEWFDENEPLPEGHLYRLGGNSCLSGDYMGVWRFDKEIQVGDTIIFEDMIHYTTVKTNMFNGVDHPSMYLHHLDGKMELLRCFSYEDYRDRMN